MIFSLKNNSDRDILLKSVLCVFCAAAVMLLLVRHTVPSLSDDKSYGGSVLLMLPGSADDVRNFQRWQVLNQPSSIFGYNSGGIFSALLPEKVKNVIPQMPHFSGEGFRKPSLAMPEYALIPLKTEKRSSVRNFLHKEYFPAAKNIGNTGVQVFDEKGNECTVLQDLPQVSGAGTLLIRAEKGIAGVSLRIMESSGSREFDYKAAAALEQKALQGVPLSGVLAVWPESKGGK